MINPRILYYDLETSPISADLFSTGKQYISHQQLQNNRNNYDIICIQYMFDTDKKVSVLSHIENPDKSTRDIMNEFSHIVSQADIVIGKNSNRFDSKHVNTQLMLAGLPSLPDWFSSSARDDLEVQLRKYFYFPSYSLDYVSKLLIGSGKDKMEFKDWLDIRAYKECKHLSSGVSSNESMNHICQFFYGKGLQKVIDEGRKALDKMYKYGAKDVMDTKKLWHRVLPYIQPKLNRATFAGNIDGNYMRCKHCGGEHIIKNGIDNRNSVPKQRYWCLDCKRHAGSSTIKGGKVT